MIDLNITTLKIHPKDEANFMHWGSSLSKEEFTFMLFNTVERIKNGEGLQSEYRELMAQIDPDIGDGIIIHMYNPEELANFFADLCDNE